MGERAGRGVPNANQMVGQMVEGTPEIMNRISDNERERVGNISSTTEIVDAFSRLQIVLMEKGIGVFGQKGIPLGLHITDVLFGPFNF